MNLFIDNFTWVVDPESIFADTAFWHWLLRIRDDLYDFPLVYLNYQFNQSADTSRRAIFSRRHLAKLKSKQQNKKYLLTPSELWLCPFPSCVFLPHLFYRTYRIVVAKETHSFIVDTVVGFFFFHRVDWNECNLVNVWFYRLVFRHDKRYEKQRMVMEMNKFDSDLDIESRETENLLILRNERSWDKWKEELWSVMGLHKDRLEDWTLVVLRPCKKLLAIKFFSDW